MIVTNQVWLCVLSRDCPGQADHLHASIGFDKEVQTKDLAPFSGGLVRRWSRALADFIADPKKLCCPACADEAGRRNWPGPARERRRAASALVVEGAKLIAARDVIPGSLPVMSGVAPGRSPTALEEKAGQSFLALAGAEISREGPAGSTLGWPGAEVWRAREALDGGPTVVEIEVHGPEPPRQGHAWPGYTVEPGGATAERLVSAVRALEPGVSMLTTRGEGSPTWIVGLRREARMATIEPASVPVGAEVAAFALNEYQGERAWRLLGRSVMAAEGFHLELCEPVEILLVEVRQPLLALDVDWAEFRA